MRFIKIACYHCGWRNMIHFTEANLKKWVGYFGKQQDKSKPAQTVKFICENCGKLNIKSTAESIQIVKEASSTGRVSFGRVSPNWEPTQHRTSPDS